MGPTFHQIYAPRCLTDQRAPRETFPIHSPPAISIQILEAERRRLGFRRAAAASEPAARGLPAASRGPSFPAAPPGKSLSPRAAAGRAELLARAASSLPPPGALLRASAPPPCAPRLLPTTAVRLCTAGQAPCARGRRPPRGFPLSASLPRSSDLLHCPPPCCARDARSPPVASVPPPHRLPALTELHLRQPEASPPNPRRPRPCGARACPASAGP